MKKILKIKGMHCASCEILLTEAIEEAGTAVISADHKKGEITVDMKDEKEIEKINQAIKKEGYTIA